MKPEPLRNEKLLKEVYFQIIEGYTPTIVGKEKVWIKHFNVYDQTTLDNFYNKVRDEAESKGLPTEKEAIKALLEAGHWTKEEEDELQHAVKMRDALLGQKSKAVNDAMLKMVEADIETHTKKAQELRERKKGLLHDTCEDVAQKRCNDLIVKLSFCKTKEGEPLYTDEEFEYLDRREIYELVGVYNDATENLSISNIQEIAAQDFFSTYYSLVEKNPIDFFQKKVYELTFFQVNLLNYGRLINSIHANYNPPDHLRNDGKGLIAFASNQSKQRKKEAAKNQPNRASPATL